MKAILLQISGPAPGPTEITGDGPLPFALFEVDKFLALVHTAQALNDLMSEPSRSLHVFRCIS